MKGSRSSKRRRRAANKFQKQRKKLLAQEPEAMVKITVVEVKYNFRIMKPVEETENVKTKMVKRRVRVGKQYINVKCQAVMYTYEKWVPADKVNYESKQAA